MNNNGRLAVVADFDKTLSPRYMQTPLFNEYGVEEVEFWCQCNARGKAHPDGILQPELNYLTTILDGTSTVFQGLDNSVLYQLGSRIELYPSVKSFIEDILLMGVEFHIVTTGISTMLEGLFQNLLSNYRDKFFIHGSTFSEHQWDGTQWVKKPHIVGITNLVRAQDKPVIIKGIINGFHRLKYIMGSDYQAPMLGTGIWIKPQDICYVGDGITDLPAYEYVYNNGGHTVLVYDPSGTAEAARCILPNSMPIDTVAPACYGISAFTGPISARTAISDWCRQRLSMYEEIERRAFLATFSGAPVFTLNGTNLSE